MTTTKQQAAITRPEQYHLEEAPKLRAAMREQAAELEQRVEALRQAAVRAAIQKAGIRVPDDAKFVHDRYSSGSGTFEFGKVSVRLRGGDLKRGSDTAPAMIRKPEQEAAELSRKAQALCRIITTSAARQFGAFCRTKYGPKPDLATIQKAHGEWLDLQFNCKC